jgi:methylphosphotriester-DNA--protein-cysteine methyltransferase
LGGEGDEFLPAGEANSFRVVRTRAASDPVTGSRLFRSGIGVSFRSYDQAEQLADAQAQLALDAALSGSAAVRAGYAYLVNRKMSH